VIDPPNDSNPRVIHVALPNRPRSDLGTTEDVDRWLAAVGAQVERCGDVYRALARILRASPQRWQACVVCVGVVGSAEMEFFSLLSRLRRQLKVYVYSNGADRRKVAEAIERGAAGPVSSDVFQALVSGVPQTKRDESAPAPQPIREVAAAEPPEEAAESQTVDEVEDQSARVPWLRYTDRPQRAAPTRTRPQTPVAEPIPTSVPEDPYEPLLTQAELDALMSDDISTIAPNEPPGRRRDEKSRGES